jgi:hypothetical protein
MEYAQTEWLRQIWKPSPGARSSTFRQSKRGPPHAHHKLAHHRATTLMRDPCTQDEATVVETRALAATALQGMVTRDDVNNIERNIVQLMMSEGVLEDIFCAFMRSRDPLLEERGAKGAAHLAIVKSRQVWKSKLLPTDCTIAL